MLRKVIEGWGEHMKAATRRDPGALGEKYTRRFEGFPQLQALALRHLQDSERPGSGD